MGLAALNSPSRPVGTSGAPERRGGAGGECGGSGPSPGPGPGPGSPAPSRRQPGGCLAGGDRCWGAGLGARAGRLLARSHCVCRAGTEAWHGLSWGCAGRVGGGFFLSLLQGGKDSNGISPSLQRGGKDSGGRGS